MKLFTIVSLIILLCCSCQKDIKQKAEKETVIEKQSPKPKALGLNARIGNAYNVKKFQSESFLKYSVDISFLDTTYFKGTLTYNILKESLNVKKNNGEFDLDNNPQDAEVLDLLSDLNSIYTLPFYLDNENLNTIQTNDSIVKSKFTSSISKLTYEINTHPLTEIIQSIKIENPKSIFHNSTIRFDRYITVNRIPVAMLWEIFKEDEMLGQVKISRISYPKA
jgi:hypothetical protein